MNLTSVVVREGSAVALEPNPEPSRRWEQDDAIIRRAAHALPGLRDGIKQVQQRLRELHQQHSLEQQAQTDSRIRFLTILSAVFLPLTLMAGIYGMNFENMPELHAEYAYFLVLLAMAIVALGMLGYFVRKGWFK